MEGLLPIPAVVVAGRRTGGTFLCSCLSNHPTIFCERGEVLHWESEWQTAIPNIEMRLDLIFRQAWYTVSMCKLISDDALEGKLWEFLQSYPSMRIIFLEREDTMAQALSWEMNIIIRKQGGHSHSFSGRDMCQYKLDPAKVIWRWDSIINRLARSKEVLETTSVPVLHLTYEELTNGEDTFKIKPEVATKVCEFLGVEYWTLFTQMNKMHTVPWKEQIINWEEIQNALCNRK